MDRAGTESGTAASWPLVERRKRARIPDYPRLKYWQVQPDGNRSRVYQFCKRALDIAGACLILVMVAPVMLVTYALLFVTTRGKPIFRQQRVGECGRLFTLYKFRTMRLDADMMQCRVRNEQAGPVFKNRRDPRVTRIGRVLRKFSIDELPQLFNVLKGDMTLVGPRPPLESEVQKYQNWQLRRLSVKPGLTCLWQVSGRCEIPFVEWVRLDLRYIDRQNLRTDFWLLAKTPACVLSGRGAY